MSHEFFDHMYSGTFGHLGRARPTAKSEVEISGDPDAESNIAKQLGCQPGEVSDQLQHIQGLLIASGVIPTSKDIAKIQKRSAEEHAEAMKGIRRKAAERGHHRIYTTEDGFEKVVEKLEAAEHVDQRTPEVANGQGPIRRELRPNLPEEGDTR